MRTVAFVAFAILVVVFPLRAWPRLAAADGPTIRCTTPHPTT